jgi:multiple sugar transport system ATP-binding protein
MAEIQLKSIHKSFGAVPVIKGVDLTVKAGEFMVFVGPSGCGKSTLLRLICGLEDITSGDMFFDGERVNELVPSKRGIAMVFQSYALYPHMTVYDNMAFGMQLAKASPEETKKRIETAAEMLQLTPYLARLPKQLSGGQRQRVAIGRAIVRDPKVFLFDEPLSNLDAALRVATRIEIAKLHESMHGTTMVYVTHDQVEAMTLADRICVLDQGRVEQVGTPMELYDAPANIFVAGFIGSPKMNFISGDAARKQKCLTLGIRPEHIDIKRFDIKKNSGVITGIVDFTENLGADSFIYVKTEYGLLTARESGKTKFKNGDKVGLTPLEGQVHRFDDAGKRIN